MGDVAKVQEEERKARAFKAFQDAARNKDKDPDTFEAARMRYYFLAKGPAWLTQEKQRLTSEKLDPIIAQYRDVYTSLSNEEDVQRAYTDSIEAVKDKQSTIKTGAQKQASYFQKLLDEQQQKKSAFDRFVELTSPKSSAKPDVTQDAPFVVKYFAGFPSSFNIILDVILGLFIAIILYLAVVKVKRVSFPSFFRYSQPSYFPSTGFLQSPTPTVFGSPGR